MPGTTLSQFPGRPSGPKVTANRPSASARKSERSSDPVCRVPSKNSNSGTVQLPRTRSPDRSGRRPARPSGRPRPGFRPLSRTDGPATAATAPAGPGPQTPACAPGRSAAAGAAPGTRSPGPPDRPARSSVACFPADAEPDARKPSHSDPIQHALRSRGLRARQVARHAEERPVDHRIGGRSAEAVRLRHRSCSRYSANRSEIEVRVDAVLGERVAPLAVPVGTVSRIRQPAPHARLVPARHVEAEVPVDAVAHRADRVRRQVRDAHRTWQMRGSAASGFARAAIEAGAVPVDPGPGQARSGRPCRRRSRASAER